VTTTIEDSRTGQDTVPPDYTEALARLAGVLTREAMAQRIDALAAVASQTAGALKGRGAPYSSTDPLAWYETATMLVQLAAALRGHRIDTDEISDHDYYAEDYWKDLACAVTAPEFAVAFQSLTGYFAKKLDGYDETAKEKKGDAEADVNAAAEPAGAVTARRRFALRMLTEVGNAVAAAWPAPRR
jgi:hypothetical protein